MHLNYQMPNMGHLRDVGAMMRHMPLYEEDWLSEQQRQRQYRNQRGFNRMGIDHLYPALDGHEADTDMER